MRRERWLMLLCRRCVRTVILASLAISLLVSLTLLFALVVTDDATRLCPVSNTQSKSDGQSWSVLRQLNQPLASNINHKLPRASEVGTGWQHEVDSLLRVLLTSRNESVMKAQSQLTDLRVALRRIEHRLDDLPQPTDSPVSDDKPSVMREPLSQQRQQANGVMTDNAGLLGFSKALSRSVDDKLISTLKDIADKYHSTRRHRPSISVTISPIHRKPRSAWQYFHNNITQYELYRTGTTARSYVDDLLKNMASLPVVGVDEMAKKGTQIKLILKLGDGTKVLFKPMRISKDVEANPNHFVFNEMERHHAEIAAFHLDRLLGFNRVPPVAGRYINMTSEIRPFAGKHLNKTFFTSPAGNVCFYGECKYYCDSHHAVCGSPDIIEGSCAAFLPSEDDLPRTTWHNPWAQLYTKRNKLPKWKTEQGYCEEVRKEKPYDTGRRLIDVIDIAIFDFLTGNLDRHHYYTFEDFGNFTAPVLTDNGRGFGRARKDDVQLLAPLFQCCAIRASTLAKLTQFLVADHVTSTGTGQSLSAAMRMSLSDDVISGVLNSAHLAALDRRVRLIALLVYDCLQRTSGDFRSVVIDDGF